DQVYNEFSSGMLDPTAIRMFAKMFYDRSVSSGTPPKYLLLFGDGTYDPKDRVSNNNNYVPTYQVLDGENHISALVTDDYYGMLDNNEAITPTDLLDIGVGRLLISDTKTAKEQVDKIEHYMKNGSSIYSNSANSGQCNAQGASSTFGDWRLNYVQIADDEEGGYFVVQDTEPQYDYVKANHRDMNCDKLYCDAYTQVTTAGGERYPDIFNAITDRVERGALVVNYVGHGGEVGLAEERVVTVPQIQSWSNINKLNLFVSATCEFTKYDDPARLSAGEYVSLNAVGGAIALMTTSRSVFFGVNTVTGLQFYEHVFTRDSNNEPLAFGEIMRLTKNGSGSSDNKRSFTLIGDPALKIALPRLRVVTDTINGLSPVAEIDTIRALSKVTIKGHLEDFNGNLLSNFNGIVTPSILDKPKNLSTLGQNADSPVIDFELQKNIVYKGKATVTNGNFAFSFIVPKDINFSYSNGKISYYASDIQTDASGSDDRLIIGGIDPNGITDTQGPDISLYINDKNFVSGGITDETPQLLAELFDENGINTVGNGIGHDLTVILDDNTANPIVLNDYYSAALDSYQSGEVNYSFPTLEKGKHKLTVKVWDVNNNSSEKSIDFIVQEKAEMALDHVLNYPNPFTTKTQFYFEHNQVCSQLETQIQIFTVSGRLVRTLNQIVNTEGFRSQGIDWDGRDDFGDQLAKGVYVYTLKVNSPDGTKAEKTEKLVLLK
ncbi:MAG: type IX secretion system sortase PorU, partial [Flavobacteriia bacterium]